MESVVTWLQTRNSIFDNTVRIGTLLNELNKSPRFVSFIAAAVASQALWRKVAEGRLSNHHRRRRLFLDDNDFLLSKTVLNDDYLLLGLLVMMLVVVVVGHSLKITNNN